MTKKSAQVIDMQLSKDTKELKEIVGRRERDKLRGGELLAKHEAVMRKNSLWLKWLSDDIGITEPTAIHWIKIYEQNQGESLKNFSSTPRKDKRISSGRTAPAGGRGRGGGKGTTADSVAAAATSPSNPTPAPASSPTPVGAGQEGADKSISALSAPIRVDFSPALAEATARIEYLERTQAMLLETNRDLAQQLEAAEAAQIAGGSEKRISDLLEKLRERDMRIDELNAQIAAGVGTEIKKRLDNQAKLIEDLRKSEVEQRRCADAARKPGPRGLATMFQLMRRGDQMEFVRALAGCDDPEPGAQDAEKVGWIDIIFKKIHSPQMKRELLGNLSSGVLVDVLVEHATSVTPVGERKPVDHRRLTEPGELSKANQFGKRSNGRHAT